MSNLLFQYDLGNLQASALNFSALQTADYITLGIFLVIVFGLVFAYRMSLYAYGYILLRREQKLKDEKRNTIQELILMKSIQEELEQEIEESLLNNAFIRANQA